MPGPLDGLKIVDMGVWVAAPSAAGILCDWGADVIKVEPPQGDPFRGWLATAAGSSLTLNPPFELDNRGKRSVALNLETEEGRRIARRIIDGADAFLSNLRPRALEALGLSYEELRQTNPGLVYCQIVGYAAEGPERDRATIDVGAFWARSGMAAAITPEGAQLPPMPRALGDHVAGCTAAAATLAALMARSRTGEGQRVVISLLRTALYVTGWDASIALRLNRPARHPDRFHLVNPLINCFQAADGRWFWLLLLEGDRHWAGLCRAMDRCDLLEDPRFADMPARRQHSEQLVRLLDAAFAQRPMAEWEPAFEREGLWWAPVNSVEEALQEPVAEQAGVLVDVPAQDGTVRMVATPADFGGTPWEPRGPSPELGQHTEEVLLDLGYDWDEIAELKRRRVIP